MQKTPSSEAISGAEDLANLAPASRAHFKLVFVSYAGADSAIANALVEQLERMGIACWIAPRDIVPGCLYADCIIDAINQTAVMVVVLSRHSVASPHVGKEIERASSKGRAIISLRADEVSLTRAMEYFLSESQWIDWSDNGSETALENLRAGIIRHSDSTLTPQPEAEARSQPSALKGRGPIIILSTVALAAVIIWLGINRRSHVVVPNDNVSQAVASNPYTNKGKSVAVLPFVDMSEKRDQDYFSDGLSEELIDQLSRISGLQVSARTSSFSFKNKPSSAAEIAKALGVSHIVEGSVRKAGTTLRITAQLIRGDTGFDVWSGTYSRPQDDIFKIQDEIAAAIVKELTGSLLTTKSSTVASTDSPLTYDLLLKGQYYLAPSEPNEAQKAADFFQQAIQSDPQSAKGWAGLSRATVNLHSFGLLSWSAARITALSHAERAVKLDPSLADAHIALGKVYKNLDQEFELSKIEFSKAYSLDPKNSYTTFWLATTYVDAADLVNALRFLKQATALDPFNSGIYEQLAWVQYCASEFQEAEASLRHLLDMSPMDSGMHALLGSTLLKEQKTEQGFAEIYREVDAEARLAALAWAFQFTGKMADGEKSLSELKSKYADTQARSIASVYAMRGSADQTFEWLERAYKQHESVISIKADPDFELVRTDPRFRAFLVRMNVPP